MILSFVSVSTKCLQSQLVVSIYMYVHFQNLQLPVRKLSVQVGFAPVTPCFQVFFICFFKSLSVQVSFFLKVVSQAAYM